MGYRPTGGDVIGLLWNNCFLTGMFACSSSLEFDSTVGRPYDEDTGNIQDSDVQNAYQITKTILYNNLELDLIIDKPVGDTFDVLVVYHGTVWADSQIHTAAQNTLNEFSRILDREDMMIVSVVYPEENLLMGDNIVYAEAGLLWTQMNAEEELGIDIDRVFLGGHSQGGYLVTRLNTMHATDGVIANSPGPLDMRYRCQLEEEGTVESSNQCQQLLETYGSTAINPDPYDSISLLGFTSGHLSPILLIQGMSDAAIQLHSWPIFTSAMEECTDCVSVHVVEAPNVGHPALFESASAIDIFNDFIQ